MSKDKRALHKVEEKLVYLYSIKSPLIKNKREYEKKSRLEEDRPLDPYKSYYNTDITFSVIKSKEAELASGIQDYEFIPLDDNAKRYIPLFKYIWKYVWFTTKTDANISRAISSALNYGDGYLYEGTRKVERMVKLPNGKDENGKLLFREESRIDWDGIYQEYIPWDNFYHDGETIDTANEAIWIKDWDRTDYIKTHELNPNYKNINEDIPVGRYYYVTSEGHKLEVYGNLKDRDIVSELRYYNKAKDELIILANGIEVYCGPIPYPHKELPFINFVDIYIEGRPYNMGEYELLKDEERYKDALRSLTIDVIKHQFGFTAIDPDSDFDETTVQIGTGKYARVNPKDIAHFAPNISTSSVREAEAKADEDIIIKSGIDFRSQLLSPSETAEKTKTRKESGKKRINYTLKENAYSFFERLARLRMANIKTEFSSPKKIFIKGGNIDSKGVFTPTNNGYGTFTTKPEYINGEFNLVPITDSILGERSEKELEKWNLFLEKGGNMMKGDGTPVIDNEKAVRKLGESLGIDVESVLSSSKIQKTPEDIMRKLKNETKGIPNDRLDPNSPEFIPGAQQSGAKLNVPIGGTIQK